MGMCASQARLLMLTARKDDLQFRMMQITNAKMMLAMQTEEAALKKSDAIENARYTTMKTKDGSEEELDYSTLTSMLAENNGQGKDVQKYIVIYQGKAIKWDDKNSNTKEDNVDNYDHWRDGKVQKRDGHCWNKNDKKVEHIVNADPEEFQRLIKTGQIQIQMFDAKEKGYVPTNISSNKDFRESNLDEGAMAAAESEYDAIMAKINAKEKLLDIEAEQIETQQNAVTTEIESVQNLVKKESERTFKYFS